MTPMVLRTLTAAAFMAALPALARADWQGLPYGVTIDELRALVPSARENDDRGKDTGTGNTTMRAWLTAGYQVNGVPVDAFFQFDLEGRYRQVVLEVRRDIDCGALIELVRGSYGPVTDVTEIENILLIEEYRDVAGGNRVILNVPVGSDTNCNVNYRALSS